MYKTITFEERFWEKVDIRGKDECWNWLRALDGGGYGRITENEKSCYSHRISWVLSYGEIPPNMCICHHCDNRRCVNPKHLFLGSVKDNVNDRDNKGRAGYSKIRGNKNGNAKLTWEQVSEIRKKYRFRKITTTQLAKEYNVTDSTICNVVRNKIWVE